MKAAAALLIAFAWPIGARAQPAGLPATLLIERSTAAAALGQRATLTVSPLKRRGERYVGSYQMAVAPVSFASESGKLEITLPADALRRTEGGKPVAFTGAAANDAGKSRTVKGIATPADSQHGAVQMEIHSERGTLKFSTTYRFR